MLSTEVSKRYDEWEKKAVSDPDLIPELKKFTEETIEDAFYRDLVFGTGGLRGTIGAGTNRMNVYTVGRASRGVSSYIKDNFKENHRSVVIGYDSRIKSHLFAQTAAAVFASQGLKVYIWDRILPVPTVSFAVRYLHASAGVMITASHNPSQYNGYKVYGDDGCQITTETAADILSRIEKLGYFDEPLPVFNKDNVSFIPDEVLDAFIKNVKAQSVLAKDESIDRNVSIVYTPLNGTGLEPVTRVLKETGFTNITVVDEQRDPDGNFPTCPYPNPEIREAMELGLKYCENVDADILIATDPDCDRCGIAVRANDGSYELLTANETGILLFDFICSQRIKNGTMPKNPVMMKTIVTSDTGDQIAEHYGVDVINVLTGFKFIGEQIGILEKEHREEDYIFGFEESYGYLTGTYVRDKDGVDASFMIAEMFSYYKTHGISLIDKLEELYQLYGYRLNTLHSFKFEGSSGLQKMKDIMNKFHNVSIGESMADVEIKDILDYSKGLDGLPKSDVLKYKLDGNSSVVVRPSGTEPKLKVYISITAKSMYEAKVVEKELADYITSYMK